MFVMTAILAYVPPMLVVNFFIPDCNAQITNSIAKVNVSRTDENPVTSPDNSVNAVNVMAAFFALDKIQSVSFLYHFVSVLMVGFFVVFSGMK